LEWTTKTFDGTIRAKSGSGYRYGHHGTLWVTPGKWDELWNATDHVSYDIALAPGTYNIAELYIDSGVTLECQGDDDGNPVDGSGVTINATSITIEEGAKLSANTLGFVSNEGPGAGRAYADQGSGGSHGGRGGDGVGAAHRSVYGLVDQPTALGSGGGDRYGWGGIGGGAIKLNATDGTVSANGYAHFGDRAGGGAGGSVWLITGTLEGSGAITADGGNGNGTEGGGAGGGRISLEWTSRTFDGLIRARSGSGYRYGHHGTIWVPGARWGELWNNTFHVTGDIALAPGTYNIAELYIDSGVTLECQGDPTAINAPSGGTGGDPHGSGVTITAATGITIEEGARVSADTLGFVSNQGPGAGAYAADQGAGGSYGGKGGDGAGAPAAAVYGVIDAPTALGSGGAHRYGWGGIGGGAIKLDATGGTITIDGTITANGYAHFGERAGGGAGGSIWLIAAQTINTSARGR